MQEFCVKEDWRESASLRVLSNEWPILLLLHKTVIL